MGSINQSYRNRVGVHTMFNWKSRGSLFLNCVFLSFNTKSEAGIILKLFLNFQQNWDSLFLSCS